MDKHMDGVRPPNHETVDVLSIAWDDAVVLQADLVGFSRLAADLAREGPRGAEQLSNTLEQFFGTIIRTVETAGGLIAGFAGDAVIAIWPATADATVAQYAAQCAHRELLAPLKCRISIAIGGAGIDRFTHAGRDEMWLATGPAAELAAQLNADANPGNTVVGHVLNRAARPGDAQQARLVPRHDRTPLTRVWHEISGESGAPSFRDLTVLSCDVSTGTPSAELSAQQVADRLTRIYNHIGPWGGLPVNMVSEEKGMVLHVVFGLPPLGPTGRELRAMRAAAAISQDPCLVCPVGVVDGRMFLSPHGTQTIRTVSAMGWPSSLATRLMQASTDAPLVNASTAERAGGDIATTLMSTRTFKGWQVPVPVRSIHHPSATGLTPDQPPQDSPIAHWLDHPGQPQPLRTIGGPRGIGRSHHLRALCRIAQARGWQVIRPTLRPTGHQLAYDGIARVTADIAAAQGLNYAPLTGDEAFLLQRLNPLQDIIAAPARDTSRPLPNAEVQRETLENALHQVISDALGDDHPTLIAIDDAQNLDRSSFAMLERLARDGVRVVQAIRLSGTSTQIVPDYQVPPLDLAGTDRMICALTGAPTCEPDTANTLYQHSQGNPLFLKDLVGDLSRSGKLATAGGALRLPTAEPADAQRRSIAPVTLRELAATRLDRCCPLERQVLVIASVLRERISAPRLANLPNVPTLGEIELALAGLVTLGLLVPSQPGQLRFPDELVRDACYEELPFATRRVLHMHLAELCGPDDLADAVRHWTGAECPEKAFACHEQLAKNASALFAQDEAIAHASQARLLAQQYALPLPTQQRLELLMTEGTAALEAVELRMAEARLLEALAVIGRPQPRNILSQAFRLLPALTRQAWHRARGRAAPRMIPHAAMAATAHKDLAEIAYFEGRLGEVLLHTLQSLNIAEQVNLTSEMVAGYSALSIGFETTGLAKIADIYANRARDTALAGNSPHDRAFASLVALVLYSGRGDWQRADPAAHEAIRLYAELGAGGRLRQSSATYLHSRLARGHLREGDTALTNLNAGLDSRVSAQIRVWVKTARIGAALASKSPVPDDAYQALIGLVGHPQLNAADELFALCCLSLADLLTGDADLAHSRASQALAMAEKSPPAAWHLCNALRWLCCSTALMADPRNAHRARKVLRQFARKMPVAAAAADFHSAFDQRNVAKRTDMLASAARLALDQNLANDAEVFANLADALGQPIPTWLQTS